MGGEHIYIYTKHIEICRDFQIWAFSVGVVLIVCFPSCFGLWIGLEAVQSVHVAVPFSLIVSYARVHTSTMAASRQLRPLRYPSGNRCIMPLCVSVPSPIESRNGNVGCWSNATFEQKQDGSYIYIYLLVYTYWSESRKEITALLIRYIVAYATNKTGAV